MLNPAASASAEQQPDAGLAPLLRAPTHAPTASVRSAAYLKRQAAFRITSWSVVSV